MSHSSVMIPSIDPMILSDWLDKLGEKAFLAWLHFHNWNCDKNPHNNSHVIPLSLNQVIKRLKTGKATFYYRILRPLLQYGLVGLQTTSHHKQVKNLVVHSFPCLPTEQYEEAVNSTMSITEQSTSTLASPIGTRQQERQLEEGPLQQNLKWTPFEDRLTFDSFHQSTCRNPRPLPEKMNKPDINPTLVSLPSAIQQTMMNDPRLMERSIQIVEAYAQCQHHSCFDVMSFRKKMLTCLEYPHVKKENYGSYLLKAVLNEWDVKPPVSPASPTPLHTTSSSHPMDVPEWIVAQQERARLGIPYPQTEIAPEDKAYAEELMRQLGEWPSSCKWNENRPEL